MAFLGPSLRRTKVHERPRWRIAGAALVSLLVNGLVLVLLARAGAFTPPKPLEKQEVQLAQLSAKDWSANRTIRAPDVVPPAKELPAPPPPRPEEQKPEERKPPGQVVDVAPSNDHRPPANPRYLSEQDNRVEKETRSRYQGSGVFHNRAPTVVPGETHRRKAGDGGADQETKEARQGQRGTNQTGGKGTPEPEPRPQAKDDRLALLEPHPNLPRVSPAPPHPGGGEEGPGVPGLPGTPQTGTQKSGDARLLPSVDSMSRIASGPSTDALDPELEQGEVTALNTKAFRFATFWNRFKQDVSEHWFPLVDYEIGARDPNGAIYGRTDRVTALKIVLDGKGTVKAIEVSHSCGLAFLDDLAVKAVREASPYYNVPPALIDPRGELSFEFSFLISRAGGVPIRPHYQPLP